MFLRTLAHLLLFYCICYSLTSVAHQPPDVNLKHLNAALRQNPTSPATQLERAQARWRVGNYQGALDDTKQILQTENPPKQTWLLQGLLLEELGAYQKSEDALLFYLDEAPNTVKALAALGRIKQHQSKPKKALHYFLRAAQHGDDPDYYLLAAKSAEALNKPKQAIEILTQGWEKQQRPVSLAIALRERGQALPEQPDPPPSTVTTRVTPQPITHEKSALLLRQPYIQNLSHTAVTIVWRSKAKSLGHLHFGKAPDKLNLSAVSRSFGFQHEVRLTGLKPNTRYYYSISLKGQRIGSPQHFFETAPLPGSVKKTRIWVVGDSGTGSLRQKMVRDAMLNFTEKNRLDLYLHVGDMAYSRGTDFEFTKRFFGIYENILRNTPIWPALGNHEGITSQSRTQTGPYYQSYSLPKGGESGGLASGTEAYYSFDYANIHFIVLDSYHSSPYPGGAQLTWLEADLEQNKQEWIIAYWHHPPYSKGSHDSDKALRQIVIREKVLPLLEKHNVDLVLAGHSHIYERSYLLHGAYNTPSTKYGIMDAGDGKLDGQGPYSKSDKGALYIVAGHGGTVPFRKGTHPLMAHIEAVNGSVILDVYQNKMLITNLRYDGKITDQSALIKGADILITAPTPSSRLTPNQQFEIQWSAGKEIKKVDLHWSCDNGNNWHLIAKNVDNEGSYNWTVPNIRSDKVLFHVQQHGSFEVHDESIIPLAFEERPIELLISFGDKWRYHDKGVDLGSTWRAIDYNDSGWPEGKAELGYGDPRVATQLTDPVYNHPSAYFRKELHITEEIQQAQLEVIFDDGVAVWINDTLVLKRNMGKGLGYAAWASQKAYDNSAAQASLDGSLFRKGKNVIAAIVKPHHFKASDISFDLQLEITQKKGYPLKDCPPPTTLTSKIQQLREDKQEDKTQRLAEPSINRKEQLLKRLRSFLVTLLSICLLVLCGLLFLHVRNRPRAKK